MMSFALVGHGADRAAKPNGKTAAPELDFLEYLGTLEGDEENWTDVVKIELSEMANNATAAKPISSSDAGASGKSKKVEPNATKSQSKAESGAQSGK